MVEDALSAELQMLCGERRAAATQVLRALEGRLERGSPSSPTGPDFFEDAVAPPPVRATLPGSGPGYGPKMERSILELVQAQSQRLQTMSDELDTVRASLNERKTVERAKGLLMAHRHLSEDEAHKTMRQIARNQNRRLINVTEAVLAMAEVLPARGR